MGPLQPGPRTPTCAQPSGLTLPLKSSLSRPRRGKKKGRQLTPPAPHKRKVTVMTIAQHEGTGPVHVQAQTVPAIPLRVRRRLTFAVYGRQAKRRTTWVQADRAAARAEAVLGMPWVGVVTGIIGALTLSLALCGWVIA